MSDRILSLVAAELAKAQAKHPAFHSAHEGYAVIKEELDELWALVMLKEGKRTRGQLTEEAVQIAAMAIRFVIDVADKTNPVTDDLCAVIGEMDEAANKRLADPSGFCPRCFGWLPERCICSTQS